MPNETWQYGSYAYPNSLVLSRPPREIAAKERTSDTPGRIGGYSAGGILAPRRFTVVGQLLPQSGDTRFDTWDDWDGFLAAHSIGTIRQLLAGRDDRYINAEVVGISDPEGENFPTSIPWSVGFLAVDPTFYAVSATGPTTVTAGGVTLTNNGNIETYPTIVVVLSALGTAGTLTLTNSTTGKALVIAMPGSLTTLTVDMALQKVTNTGGTDVTNLVTSGSFWGLQPGNNTFNRTWGGSANASSITATYRDRWM